MTAQFWLWLILSGMVGGIVGWVIRGLQNHGRELTIKREFDNRLAAVEDDSKRSLARSRAETAFHWRKVAAERDAFYSRLSELDPGGTWKDAGTRPELPTQSERSAPVVVDMTGAVVANPPEPTPHAPAASRPGRPRKAMRPVRRTNGASDDLQRIKGIGPAFELRLKEMGYATYGDIAGWSPEDLDRLSEHLGARIRLQEWAEAAASLQDGNG